MQKQHQSKINYPTTIRLRQSLNYPIEKQFEKRGDQALTKRGAVIDAFESDEGGEDEDEREEEGEDEDGVEEGAV